MESIIDSMAKQGFAVQEGVFTAAECEAIGRTLDEIYNNNHWSSWKVSVSNRQHTLLNVHYAAPESLLQYISHPKIMDVVGKVLNDKFILSNFNASLALKNDSGAHRIHIDSRKPISKFNETYQIVANICIDDFTADNGSTVVVPESHLSGEDPRQQNVSESLLKTCVAPKGSVVYMPGQTWHDIGNNRSGARRWSIIAYYACWWVKPTFDFVTSCTPEIFEQCTDLQKELLGFTSRPPSRWSLRSKTVTKVSELPKNLADAQAEN